MNLYNSPLCVVKILLDTVQRDVHLNMYKHMYDTQGWL